MMDLLKQFAALSLICSLLLTLLPEGTIRRTAAMAVGLLLLLCWSEGLFILWDQQRALPAAQLQATSLAPTGLQLECLTESTSKLLQDQWEESP